MAIKRYAGEYPVIGIRPIVDGRRGPMMLRESLEPQVWAMANAAKKLFEENLCYSNGDPVKVILADTCIGRVPEAAACADKFKKAGVDITLSVTPCWCYGSETMDMDPMTIKGVWASTVPNVPVQFISQRFLQVMRRRVFPHSASTVMRFRTLTRSPIFPKTSRKNSCASVVPQSRLLPCAASPICRSVPSVWVSQAPSSIRT